MTEGVKDQQAAEAEVKPVAQTVSDKELNFRRLEQAKEAEREARLRAEMRNESLEREIQSIKQMLQPKDEDPLEGVEDYVDPARLRATLAKQEARFRKEAEEIAQRKYEQIEKEREAKSFHERLRSRYNDYDNVMSENAIADLEKTNPEFLEAVLEIPDDFKRREKTYKFLKAKEQKPAPKASIQEVVEENKKNPYYIAPGSGQPSAVEFDIGSPKARQEAYKRLKAAQRRPIGVGPAQR